MGHVINPISIRLGINTYWNSNWAINNKYNYKIMTKDDYFFFSFLSWVLNTKKWKKSNIIFSHYFIYRNNNDKIYSNIYFYYPQSFRIHKLKRWLNRNKKIYLKKKKRIKIMIIYKKLYKYLIKYSFCYLYWFFLFKTWKNYLHKFKKKTTFFFHLYNIDFISINVGVVATYIAKRLIQRHRLNYTIKPVLRDLNIRLKQKKIKGFRILCVGRFTRRQIAEKNWFKEGPVPNNNFSHLITYKQIKVRLKYGICGIKVWLNYGNKDKGIELKPANLLLPKFKICYYYLTNLKNYNLFFNVYSWSFILNRSFFSQLNINKYLFILKNKLNIILYKSTIFFILKELKYLKLNKKIKKKLFKFFFYYNFYNLIKLNYNSKKIFINYNWKILQNKKKLYFYE